MIDVRMLLDPELRPAMEEFQLPLLSKEVLATLRQQPFQTVELSDAVERTDRLVPGDPPVPIRIHRPVGASGQMPAIVSIHGGGYVIGTYDMDDAFFDRWCPKFGLVGVSVEYRLAPETPYPGPLDDCYSALRWTHEHAGELGIDPDRIGICGRSAGGGLVAGLALLARDRAEVPVALQIMEAPMLDDRQVTSSSQLDGLYVWTRESNQFGWRSYLGELYGSDRVPAYAAAARATDLAGLPPTYISVGAIDGFRDEDIDYAVRLTHAGVPCELHVYAGLPHGFIRASDARAVKLAVVNVEDWLDRQLSAGRTT
jgi:acetyl esterase/lipase